MIKALSTSTNVNRATLSDGTQISDSLSDFVTCISYFSMV